MQKLLKKNLNKIGVLGGTFDPPHKGHLYISKFAIKKLKLKKIIWAVTKKNPFKKNPYINIKTRIKLSKEIVKKEKKISVMCLDYKIKSNKTYKVLNYIKMRNKKNKIYFLIGADNLARFHKWDNWKKIIAIAKLVVFPRNKYSKKSLNKIVSNSIKKGDLIYMNSKKINVSSSLIRKFW